ncbi:MAG: NADH-quinone oxidoreductase subunit NuoH, partial [Azonexus sp.]|nr:NADH-quinone oxidoreductase subunit NuoH [Azonexus sp.]
LLLFIAYILLADRKIWAAVQMRRGPNDVGPWGLFQTFAHLLKFVFKEPVIPAGANKGVFLLAPLVAVTLALATWAVVPLADGWVIANINVGILYIFAISSLEVYGIIMGGWASNSKYPFLGALRSAAQMVSYEIAMGFSLICVLMVSNSLNLVEIVNVQNQGRFADWGLNFLSWNWLPLLPMFVVYLISGVAETNRAPFDVSEGESEIVAGFHVEYSGMAFAVFFLAEYANMILVAALTALMFLGGWLSPVGFLPDGIFWLFAKTAAILFLFLWFRATFPRYRYDQLMRLGWKVFLPICLIWLVVIGVWMMSPLNIWK